MLGLVLPQLYDAFVRDRLQAIRQTRRPHLTALQPVVGDVLGEVRLLLRAVLLPRFNCSS